MQVQYPAPRYGPRCQKAGSECCANDLHSPLDNKTAGWLAILIEEQTPVGSVDGIGAASSRDEGVCLDAVMHAIARTDTFFRVARV